MYTFSIPICAVYVYLQQAVSQSNLRTCYFPLGNLMHDCNLEQSHAYTDELNLRYSLLSTKKLVHYLMPPDFCLPIY